jgi:hypothetical protein
MITDALAAAEKTDVGQLDLAEILLQSIEPAPQA